MFLINILITVRLRGKDLARLADNVAHISYLVGSKQKLTDKLKCILKIFVSVKSFLFPYISKKL